MYFLEVREFVKGKWTQNYKWLLSKSIWETAHFDANCMGIEYYTLLKILRFYVFKMVTNGGRYFEIYKRLNYQTWFEPRHDKTNNKSVRPDWSESSLSAWKTIGSYATHWGHSEDSDQTGRIPGLIWVFAGRTVALFFLGFVLLWLIYFLKSCILLHIWQMRSLFIMKILIWWDYLYIYIKVQNLYIYKILYFY